MTMYASEAEVQSAVQSKLGDVSVMSIELGPKELGGLVEVFIRDVAKINYVNPELLTVYKINDTDGPKSVVDAIKHGTKFFDAIYYFVLTEGKRATLKEKLVDKVSPDQRLHLAKQNLLWCFLYIMMRGMYPDSEGTDVGKDIPGFLSSILKMNCKPKEVSEALASFSLKHVDMKWVRYVKITGMAPSIQQRLSLSMPGYRMLQPFKLYECKDSASTEAKKAHKYARQIATAKIDWSIVSMTRDASLTSRLGPLNANLGNLILACFTEDQINEMVDPGCKILFKKPVADPRASHWMSWDPSVPLVLNDPVDFSK